MCIYIYIYIYIWLHSNIEKCLDVVYEGPLWIVRSHSELHIFNILKLIFNIFKLPFNVFKLIFNIFKLSFKYSFTSHLIYAFSDAFIQSDLRAFRLYIYFHSNFLSIYLNFEEPNSSYIYIIYIYIYYIYIWLHSNIEKCLDVVYEGPSWIVRSHSELHIFNILKLIFNMHTLRSVVCVVYEGPS